MLKKYRPVSNLSFLTKVIEKVISIRILGHILDNNISSSNCDIFRILYRKDSIQARRYGHPPSPTWGIWGMHLLSQVTLAPPDTFLTFQTPNNGGFQEIVLAITMEDWLMGFMRS